VIGPLLHRPVERVASLDVCPLNRSGYAVYRAGTNDLIGYVYPGAGGWRAEGLTDEPHMFDVVSEGHWTRDDAVLALAEATR
jgi:hypothetical protein